MAGKKYSIKTAKAAAVRDETKLRKKIAKGLPTQDSFQNFAANLGVGTDNLMSGSVYGFNPVTRIRTQLEWIHRGSWLGGIAVDVVADDMTRAGFEFTGELDPGDGDRLMEVWSHFQLDKRINSVIKWGRLYGGALGVYLIDGQKLDTPLRVETVGKGAFKGALALDRWMVEPTLEDLVTELGPSLGLPKYYRINDGAPALRGARVHYSRVFRIEGIDLPYYQKMQENLWGISVLERLYDRMIAFDSATTGAAQLVYKSHLRTFKVKGLRALVGSGGRPLAGLTAYTDMMRKFQTNEGMSVIDGDDELNADVHSAFSGLSDIIQQFGQQLSGALQVPMVRLFGQSPSGLSAGEESGLRTYYDGVAQKQETEIKTPIVTLARLAAQSERIKLPDGFNVKFRPLWQMNDEQKANIAAALSTALNTQDEAGAIDAATVLRELKYISTITGLFSNITDEQIEAAEQDGPPIPLDVQVAEARKGALPGEVAPLEAEKQGTTTVEQQ